MVKMSCAIWGITVLLFAMANGAARAYADPASSIPNATGQERAAAKVSDWWITTKIHSQFVPEDVLDDSNIDVDTANGVVTLSGTVATAAGRDRAVAIAKATDGVKNVVDKLRIAPEHDKATREAAGAAKSSGRRVTDGWIKSKIYSQFLTEKALDDSDIDIDVRAGVVTLKGTVLTAAGRAKATEIAKATDGVKSVKDNLTVAKH